MRMFIDKKTGAVIYTYAMKEEKKLEGNERYFEWMMYNHG